MDVVAGESTGTSGQLLLLYPMLFALQVGCRPRGCSACEHAPRAAMVLSMQFETLIP